MLKHISLLTKAVSQERREATRPPNGEILSWESWVEQKLREPFTAEERRVAAAILRRAQSTIIHGWNNQTRDWALDKDGLKAEPTDSHAARFTLVGAVIRGIEMILDANPQLPIRNKVHVFVVSMKAIGDRLPKKFRQDAFKILAGVALDDWNDSNQRTKLHVIRLLRQATSAVEKSHS